MNGFVVGLVLVDGGSGYDLPPAVLLSGEGGIVATAQASVVEGVVAALTITNPVNVYTSTPKVGIASPPFAPEVSISVTRIGVTMKVVLGRKYQLQSSNDLTVWVVVGSAFVADSETITQEFLIAESGRYFRLVEVP